MSLALRFHKFNRHWRLIEFVTYSRTRFFANHLTNHEPHKPTVYLMGIFSQVNIYRS